MFFFSSRRRHTRLQGDWSSDVCSSDLAAKYCSLAWPDRLAKGSTAIDRIGASVVAGHRQATISSTAAAARSEERRVGEEWRARGAAGRQREEHGNGVGGDKDTRLEKAA